MAKTGFGPINKDHPSSSKIQSGKGMWKFLLNSVNLLFQTNYWEQQSLGWTLRSLQRGNNSRPNKAKQNPNFRGKQNIALNKTHTFYWTEHFNGCNNWFLYQTPKLNTFFQSFLSSIHINSFSYYLTTIKVNMHYFYYI